MSTTTISCCKAGIASNMWQKQLSSCFKLFINKLDLNLMLQQTARYSIHVHRNIIKVNCMHKKDYRSIYFDV